MIPIQNSVIQGSIEDLPDSVKCTLPYLKICVMGLWVFGLAYVPLNPLGALMTIWLAILGTFFFADDPQMKRCYDCLMSTAVGQCCGQCNQRGLPGIVIFFMLSAINSFFDGVQLCQLTAELVDDRRRAALVGQNMPILFISVIVKAGIFVCELFAAIFTCQILKTIRPAEDGMYQQLAGDRPPGGQFGMFGGGGGGAHAPRPGGMFSGRDAGDIPPPSAPPATRPARSHDFRPFAGEGHRLGV